VGAETGFEPFGLHGIDQLSFEGNTVAEYRESWLGR
jgi:hypothetical protein